MRQFGASGVIEPVSDVVLGRIADHMGANMRFDPIIVGAGQAGPSLAGRLTQAGERVAIVERKLFGGTCVNTGCAAAGLAAGCKTWPR